MELLYDMYWCFISPLIGYPKLALRKQCHLVLPSSRPSANDLRILFITVWIADLTVVYRKKVLTRFLFVFMCAYTQPNLVSVKWKGEYE